MIAKWSSFTVLTFPVFESPYASTREMREGSVSVSMTDRRLDCRSRRSGQRGCGEPPKRVFDALAALRARGQRVEAAGDELRRVVGRHDPLILQVVLVERDDGRHVTGSGANVAAETEKLVDRLASRAIGDIENGVSTLEVTLRNLLLWRATLDVPQQQVHLLGADLHLLPVDLHAHGAVILGREVRMNEPLDETRLSRCEHAHHAHLLLDHR